MTATTKKQLSERLSQRLANFKISDTVINRIADRVMIEGLSIARFNPCIYGICIDYFSDRLPRLEALTPKHGIEKWEVFPYGIIEWDRFHVRIAFEVAELEGKGIARGFGH